MKVAIPTLVMRSLSAPFVVSLIPKVPSLFLTAKSLLLFESVRLSVGSALVIVIFPVEPTVPSTLTLPPIVVIPAIDTPP